MVSLGFTIGLLALLLVIYCPIFSNAFVLLKSQPKSEQCEGNSPGAGWEQKEERFVALSSGEGRETINMVQDDDSQNLSNSAPKDLPLGLALSLNTGSILLLFYV